MTLWKIVLLAIVQGLAELLPVSSSAHVIVAEKLMGLDPTAPQMTLLLVMLHTGTMFAVIVYFWRMWKLTYFSSGEVFRRFVVQAIWATALTGAIGEALKVLIEKTYFRGQPKAQIEMLFGQLQIIAPALLAVGILIILSGIVERRQQATGFHSTPEPLDMGQAGWMGAFQGLALPFRGFSRSGSTISVGMIAGTAKETAERFSFALAVILTPVVDAMELHRLVQAAHRTAHGAARAAAYSPAAAGARIDLHSAILASLLGAVFSFLAGLVALKWLSSWLESGRWYWFGIYCIAASGVVFYLHAHGF